MLDLAGASRAQKRVLFAGDRENIQTLGPLVSSWNYSVDTAADSAAADRILLSNPPDILLTDGLEWVRRLRGFNDGPVAIFVGDEREHPEDVAGVVVWRCPTPVQPEDLRVLLERASHHRREIPGLYGETPEMHRIFTLLHQVAPSSASVLITGESGTGKELVARAIHRMSRRSERPFVAINCAAFPDGLVESELFGHEKGAFTGAIERRSGCLERANGGTLLLDEIGELPPQTQAKLLRVLDDSRVRRLGGRGEIQLDVRVLAATNRDLEEVMRTNHFRQDLFYRLNVFQVSMPPLRERKDDLPVLCAALIEALNCKHGRHVTRVDAEVLACFRQYSWPGNVRELRNVLETAVIVAGEGLITIEHLPERFSQSGAPIEVYGGMMALPAKRSVVAFPVGTTVDQAEQGLIQFTLQHTNNNKSRAARMLGISPKTLHCKLRQYKLQEAS